VADVPEVRFAVLVKIRAYLVEALATQEVTCGSACSRDAENSRSRRRRLVMAGWWFTPLMSFHMNKTPKQE
jgi:hypothetical protein